MHNVKIWIENHPYLTGFVLIAAVILFILIRRKSSTPAVTTVQTGPSEALQAAQLQAGVQAQAVSAQTQTQHDAIAAALASKQIDAAVATQTSADQLSAVKYQSDIASMISTQQTAEKNYETSSALNLGLANIDAQRDLGLASISGQVSIAGIQAGVQTHAIDAALSSQKDIDATSVSLAKINTASSDFQAGLGATVDLAKISAAKDVAIDTNSTNVSLATIAANVENNKTAAAVTINGQNTNAAIQINAQDTALISHTVDVQGNVDVTAINAAATAHASDMDTISNLIRGGYLGSGSSGAAEETSVLDTLLGNPTGGAVAAGGVVAANNPANGLGAQIGAGLSGGADLLKSLPAKILG